MLCVGIFSKMLASSQRKEAQNITQWVVSGDVLPVQQISKNPDFEIMFFNVMMFVILHECFLDNLYICVLCNRFMFIIKAFYPRTRSSLTHV